VSLSGRLDRLEDLFGREEPLEVTRAKVQLIGQIEALIEQLSPEQVADAYEAILRDFPGLRRG
jgi:hypothetical protein